MKFFFGNPQRFREFPIEINVVFMHLVFIISNSGTVLLASMTSSSQLSASICHLPYRSFLQWTPADLQQTQPGFRPFQLCLGLFASKAGGGGGGVPPPPPAQPPSESPPRRDPLSPVPSGGGGGGCGEAPLSGPLLPENLPAMGPSLPITSRAGGPGAQPAGGGPRRHDGAAAIPGAHSESPGAVSGGRSGALGTVGSCPVQGAATGWAGPPAAAGELAQARPAPNHGAHRRR